MKTRFHIVWVLAVFVGANLCLWADNPYRDNIEVQRVNTAIDNTLNKAQATVSAVEGTVRQNATALDVRLQNGMNSLGKGLEDLAKAIDALTGGLKTAGNSVANSANGIVAGDNGCMVVPGSSGSTGAQSPSGTQNSGKELGQSVKDFFGSLGQLAKSFWGWVKAAWQEITGPSKEEAPLTNAVNDIKTDWEKVKMEQAAKKVNQSAGKMFQAIGSFFKTTFN
ncbi:MAG TPA: hypothetical protein PKO06_19225 [Candidatus Ozemobacteraceae bacterium]|nr:hypothetical protein [Candidatus Ozemobacteraceae bacterium]